MTARRSVTVRARTHPPSAHSGQTFGHARGMGCANMLKRGGSADIYNTREAWR